MTERLVLTDRSQYLYLVEYSLQIFASAAASSPGASKLLFCSHKEIEFFFFFENIKYY
jgi:hypothetical protein